MKKILIIILLTITNLAMAQMVLYTTDNNANTIIGNSISDASVVYQNNLKLSDGTPVFGYSLSKQPSTGNVFIIGALNGQSNNPRFLGVINDIYTGVVTNIGSTGDAISSIAFAANGTLYAVSGDGATNNGELYSVNISDGTLTLLSGITDNDDGAVIGVNPNDGLIYYLDGTILSTIDPVTFVETPVIASVVGLGEATGMVFDTISGNFLAVDRSDNLTSMTVAGIGAGVGDLDPLGNLSGDLRGAVLAPMATPPIIPAISLYGILLLSFGLMFMAVFSRKKISI